MSLPKPAPSNHRRRRTVPLVIVAILTLGLTPTLAHAWDFTGATTAPTTKYSNSHGDVWTTTWSDDDNLYSLSDDTEGFDGACFSNVAINRLTGSDPYNLTGSTVNCMTEYGAFAEPGPDGATWKGSGLTSIDGVLYAGVARHTYGGLQPTENASIIKSTDHGATWTRDAATNYNDPMWPGAPFSTPFFIEYGQDGSGGVDGADTYVYAISNEGSWHGGSSQILGRVRRDEIGNLNAANWQYYAGSGASGRLDSSWTANASSATPINQAAGRLSMTGVAYNAPLHTYVMPQWYYPNGSGDHTYTVLQIYTAPAPWGPWQLVQSQDTSPHGFYNPSIVTKFTSADGRNLIAFVNGDYTDREGDDAEYQLQVLPITLGGEGTLVDDTTTGSGINQIDYSGGSWTAETNAASVGAFGNNDHFSNTPGDTALVRFSGTAARLYAVKDPGTGVAGVAVCDITGGNCGTETQVQTYSTVREGAQAIYETGTLPQGTYSLRIRVTGIDGAGGNHYVAPDAVEVTGQRINDSDTGTGTGQVDYSGGSWTGETNPTTVGAYADNDHFSNTPGDYALVHFTGTRATATVVKDPGTGVAGFAICDSVGDNCGIETQVQTYSPVRKGNQAVYTSALLSRGDYTLRVRVTGINGAGGNHYVGLDYVDVAS